MSKLSIIQDSCEIRKEKLIRLKNRARAYHRIGGRCALGGRIYNMRINKEVSTMKSLNYEVRLRINRFLELLTLVGRKPRILAPPWILDIKDIEDRLFASFLYSGLTQDSEQAKRLFYEDFSGHWKVFKRMISRKEYSILQHTFKRIYPKGHINPRLKGYIYGKGGFEESIPYSYLQLTSNYRFSQQAFLNRPFSDVFDDLQKIKGVRRTLAFDISSGAFVVATEELFKLEPYRIYLKGSSGPLKGFTMLLGGKRETRWSEVRALAAAKFGIDPTKAEETIVEFERWLAKRAHERLRKVMPSVQRHNTILEVEDLICNYQKPIEGDWKVTNLFLEGKIDPEEFASIVIGHYYKHRAQKGFV